MSVSPLGGPGQPLPTPSTHRTHLKEKNTPAHTRKPPPSTSKNTFLHTPGGVSLPEPGPCQHHIPMTHHTHPPPPLETSHIPSTPNADTLSGPSTPTSTQTLPPPPRTPPSEHAGARDMRARQTRAHGPGRHRRAPITPTSTTRTQTVTRAPPHPAPPPNMSLMSPRGTQGSHPLSTTNHPAPPSTQERHTTRTPPVENPTRTHSHRRPPKRSHHYTLLTSENPYPSATASPPPQQPHHRTAASHSPRTHDRTTTARARVTPPPGGTLQEQVGCGSCSPAHPTCSTPMKEPPPHRSAPTTTHSGAPHRSATTSTASTSSHRRQFHPRPKNTSAHHPTTPAHHVKPLTTVEKYTRIW